MQRMCLSACLCATYYLWRHRYQWTASGILFILKSVPSVRNTLTACTYCTVATPTIQGPLTHLFVCVCVTYDSGASADLAKKGSKFYLKKTQIMQIGSFIQKQLSKLCTVRTSYGHAHLLKFKVHFKGQVLS